MHRSKSLGYIAYPILILIFLFAPEMVSISFSQSTPGTTSDSTSQPATPPPAQSTAPLPPASSTPQGAAARIRARKQQRIEQAIHELYDHKYEVEGGGGYLRFQPGSSLQKVNELLWNGAITDYVQPKLGVTLDFRGQYGTAYTYNNPYQIYKPSISQYTGLIGPQYRFYTSQRFAVSGRVLVGASYGDFDGNFNSRPPGTYLGLYPDGTTFALGIGAPVDYNLSPALAIRLSPEYLLTHFGGEFQRNKGFTLGMIYRFGKQ